ncbi:hypothetical protein B0T20DRAFT_505731, partial [Sordaria brevicollis]
YADSASPLIAVVVLAFVVAYLFLRPQRASLWPFRWPTEDPEPAVPFAGFAPGAEGPGGGGQGRAVDPALGDPVWHLFVKPGYRDAVKTAFQWAAGQV